MGRRLAAAIVALVVVLLPGTAAQAAANGAQAAANGAQAAAPTKVPISGAGSTWSGEALRQWTANVRQFGMTVNYAKTGSTDGRTQFANGTVDFGVSEIPYGLHDSNFGRPADQPPRRAFAYMPIVAGGTAFMYNLSIGNRRVTNLRLSGENIAKIFTAAITRWNDPAIRADNPGLNLPAIRIVPVVRSDGSGTTAQFTLWMSKEHPEQWNNHCRRYGKNPPCGLTSYYPANPAEGFVAKSGSDGVSGFVRQPQGEGSITYVEYAYATKAKFPVAKVLNRSNYYVEPTANYVAVALLNAEIETQNRDPAVYLTQKLDNVYRSTDPRAYPLSSYSYIILPVADDYNLNKGYTLGEFGYYLLCQGQQEADDLGYSPLPINLVMAGFQQVARIHGAEVRNTPVADCNNPTFSTDGTNTLARNAPQPPACDRKGTTQCTTGTGGAPQDTPPNLGAGPAAGGPGDPAATPSAGPSDQPVDPLTGDPIGGEGGSDFVAGIPVSLDAEGGWRLRHTMMLIAGVLLACFVFGPPLLARALSRPRHPTSVPSSRDSPTSAPSSRDDPRSHR